MEDLLHIHAWHSLASETAAEAAAGLRARRRARINVFAVDVVCLRGESCSLIPSCVSLFETVELDLVSKIVHETHCGGRVKIEVIGGLTRLHRLLVKSCGVLVALHRSITLLGMVRVQSDSRPMCSFREVRLLHV